MEKLSTDAISQLTFYQSSLEAKYGSLSGSRWPTFKIAMNLFLQRNLHTIVETGCARIKDDWGGGQSTLLFGELARIVPEASVCTVDINGRNIDMCKSITSDFKDLITYNVGDSVQYLNTFSDSIDLLYLDSYDYPDGQMVNLYGGMIKYQEIMTALNKLPEAEIVERHKALLQPCQNHCLRELESAWSNLHDRSIILMDDNNLPGGGKSRLAKEMLVKENWHCLYDSQQTIWIKG